MQENQAPPAGSLQNTPNRSILCDQIGWAREQGIERRRKLVDDTNEFPVERPKDENRSTAYAAHFFGINSLFYFRRYLPRPLETAYDVAVRDLGYWGAPEGEEAGDHAEERVPNTVLARKAT